jgi:transcriptional regulator with XRE-family HTH domain
MTEIAHAIDLNLVEKLQDREYRQKFFLAEASAHIAAQLIALRKRRGLNQQEVAKLIDTQQPAISRIEKAHYQNWSFRTLRLISDALDARIRVFIEPSEDVIHEYEEPAVSEEEFAYGELQKTAESEKGPTSALQAFTLMRYQSGRSPYDRSLEQRQQKSALETLEDEFRSGGSDRLGSIPRPREPESAALHP